jgi:hypothetical protein
MRKNEEREHNGEEPEDHLSSLFFRSESA